jgi:membrane fusion protein (multidrug efflux system)
MNDRSNDPQLSPGKTQAPVVAPPATSTQAPAPTQMPPQPEPVLSAPRRRWALISLSVVLLLAAVGYGVYWKLVLQHYESTDNAYVQAHVVQVTPQVGGTVLAVLADDTDAVKAGQPLVQLDPADARLALARAQSQLAQTVREVRTLYANNGSLAAQVQVRRADVERVRAELARADDDVQRRAPLVASGAVSGEEMNHVQATLSGLRSALAAAQSALAAAEQQALSNQALTDGTRIEQHPNVQRAAAALREAWLNLQRMQVDAPLAGQVARRTVQVGQRVAPGAPLMSIIPLDKVWVEANFKEGQLREMRIGQPVKLTADLYGDKVEFNGRISGLGAGTGAAFALLPAQNATGNWIKVVQRVPVRVALDPAQLAAHPLRVGLSMEATVDLRDRSGAPLAVAGASPAATAVQGEAVQGEALDDAQAATKMAADIIQANLGQAPRR